MATIEESPIRPAVRFEEAAKIALANTQLRRNMGKATQTIRAKRRAVVDELPDWQALREAGRAIKERTLRHLDHYLLELEASVERGRGQPDRDAGRRRPRRARGGQGQVADDRRDRAQRGAPGRRDRGDRDRPG